MIRLSELVSALTPSQFAQLALLLFFAVFVGVAWRHGGKRRAAEHAACANLPLEHDDDVRKREVHYVSERHHDVAGGVR